jgi:hypothetical protein
MIAAKDPLGYVRNGWAVALDSPGWIHRSPDIFTI